MGVTVDMRDVVTRCYRCDELVPLGGGRHSDHLRDECPGFPCDCGMYFPMMTDRTWHYRECDGRRPPQQILWEAAS